MVKSRVSEERTGWRDQALSQRHRLWGYDLPAVDIDFLMVEYDQGTPVAIIEYKHESAQWNLCHPNFSAIIRLADGCSIPAFMVRYGDNCDWFELWPINRFAREMNIMRTNRMSESEYVSFLYSLKGKAMPDEVYGILNYPF